MLDCGARRDSDAVLVCAVPVERVGAGVISGRGTVRDKDGTTEVRAGDSFFFAPGEAHQLSNAGDEDFVYYVIADNPRGDCCYYPDSGKWAVTVEGLEEIIVKGKKTDYYDGEE